MSNEHDGKVKLTLNRPALERLFEGDSELEMELKHAAVKEIVDKHFGAIIKNEAMAAYKADVTRKIQTDLKTQLGDFDRGYPWTFTLSKKARAAIESVVADKIRERIEAEVDKLDLQRMIKQQVDHTVAFRIKQGVRARLDEVTKQMKKGA